MKRHVSITRLPALATTLAVTLAIGLIGSLGWAQSQPPERSATFEVATASDSGLSGTLFVGDFGDGLSVVVLSLEGTAPDGTHPSHLHTGNCASGGGVEVPLSDVDGRTGLGVTLVRIPFDELLSRDYHVNAHNSAQDMGTIVACGEIGPGGTLVRGETFNAQADQAAGQEPGDGAVDAAAQDGDAAAAGAPQQEQMGLRSQSYQLFAVEGSGVNGTLNVTEQVEGGTTFVVTLTGIEEGENYLPVLFAGDCGPDRERITALPPVGSIANDPYTSISTVSMSFDEVEGGDFFLYIYEGEAEENPLACGEVGVGANR